ncbi:MAG: HlyD family efflux transporter periplasmic adaptor subunit [Planctomycetota bacterium]
MLHAPILRDAAPAVCTLALLLAATPAQSEEKLGVGKVSAARSVWLRSPADTTCLQVTVALGKRVARGEVLAQLDRREAELAVERTQIGIAVAEARRERCSLDLQTAESKSSLAARARKIAVEQLAPSKTLLDGTTDKLARIKAMHEAGTVSSEHLMQAEIEVARAKEKWSTAGEGVKVQQEQEKIAGFASQRSQLAVSIAEADIALAHNERERAELALAATTIRAPFDGVVAAAVVGAGTWVPAHAKMLRILETSRVRVRFDADAGVAAKLSIGDEVVVRHGEQQAQATVRALAPEETSGKRHVEIELANPDGAWLPGRDVTIYRALR